jgi:hypothetical protein
MLDRLPAVHSALVTAVLAVSAEADHERQDCEALLKGAIDMVRGQAWCLPTISERRPVRVVRIQHDPDDAAYVAIDVESGLSLLRHQDSARLRSMCARIGWRMASPPTTPDDR